MDSIIEVIVFGAQRGAVFSLVGLGLALVYKATKVLNFAQGEMGTIPAFLAYLVMTNFDLADEASVNQGMFIPATVVAVAGGALLGVVIYVLVIRKLGSATAVTTLVATAGLTLLATSIQLNVFEAKARVFPRPWAGGFRLWGTDVIVEHHTLVIMAVLAAVAVALAAFFKSPPGVALLATAQDPYAAELQGVPVERMRAVAWGAAGALGGLAGVLGAGVFASLSPGFMTSTFLIAAFIGVVLGGITSMPGAVLGGFALGIISQAAIEINQEFELGLSGPPQAAILLVLLIVLIVRPRGILGAAA